MAYWNFQGLEVALIIVICVIGFALIACTTAAIWFTVAQRNKKARIPRHLSSSDRPYIGRPVEPMVMEEGHLVKDKSKQDRAYRELTKPDGLVITSV